MRRERSKGRRLVVPIILLIIVLLYMAGRSPSPKGDPLDMQLSVASTPATFAQVKAERSLALVEPTSLIVKNTIAPILTPTVTQAPRNTVAPIMTSTVTEASLLTVSELEQISGIEYKKGSRGAGVRQLQEWLIALQYLPDGENDGSFGGKTITAFRAFQEAEGLTASGVATVATQYVLAGRAATFSRAGKGALRTGTDAFGIVKWDDTSFYIGSIADGRPDGKGTFYFAQGIYFAGSFVDGLREGKGEMHFANGDYYTGDWRADQMEGKGTYCFGGPKATERYNGKWSGSTMNGKGTYTLPDGRMITGTWKHNAYVS